MSIRQEFHHAIIKDISPTFKNVLSFYNIWGVIRGGIYRHGNSGGDVLNQFFTSSNDKGDGFEHFRTMFIEIGHKLKHRGHFEPRPGGRFYWELEVKTKKH